ncbi:MAG: CBS domain-containing protein, partial [Pseudomonadota bacterium]
MSNLQPDTSREDRREDEYELDTDLTSAIVDAVRAGDKDAVLAQLDDLHSADIADLLEQIGSDDRARLIDLAWDDIDNEVLPELEEGVRDDVLEALEPAQVAEAVAELDTDDAVYLVEDLEEAEQKEVLEALEPADRAAIAQSLTYPEDSAGRLMQRELVKAPPFWTVGQMIDFMRASDDLPEQFYDVVIVDAMAKPVGTVHLSQIMGARRPVTLGSLMHEEFRTINADEPQEDVAYAFNQYHLVSAPVVDADG